MRVTLVRSSDGRWYEYVGYDYRNDDKPIVFCPETELSALAARVKELEWHIPDPVKHAAMQAQRIAELEQKLARANHLIGRLTRYADCLILRVPDRSIVNYTTLNDGRKYLDSLGPQPGEGGEKG